MGDGCLTVIALPVCPGTPRRLADNRVKPAATVGDGDASTVAAAVRSEIEEHAWSLITPLSSPKLKEETLFKVQMTRLQLEAQDKAHARQPEFDLKRLELDAGTEKELKLQRFELQFQAEKEIKLRVASPRR